MAGTCAKPLLPTWWLIAIGWLVIVILVGGTGPFQGKGWPEIHGDDAWRLVEVQNLVAGQAWTDTTQYRDNTPYGSPMHWSRLIDAPLAVLTVALSPIYGHEAVLAAASLWPFVVLAAFLTLIVVLAERLAGPRARLPALMVTLLAFSTYAQFMGGRVDHHNVQMVIVLALMLATVVGRTSIPIAGLAGVVAATGIAVGTECLPAVLAALALFPLFWVMDPVAGRGPAVLFCCLRPGAPRASAARDEPGRAPRGCLRRALRHLRCGRPVLCRRGARRHSRRLQAGKSVVEVRIYGGRRSCRAGGNPHAISRVPCRPIRRTR